MGKESLIQSPEPPSAQQTSKICRDVCNVCGVPETEGVRVSGVRSVAVRCGVQGRGQKHVEEPVSGFHRI